MLEISGLTRRPWFEGRSLSLAAGEIVVLRAPTGSGKTLFLRTVADLDPCDAGEVSLHGDERATMAAAAWRRRVLYVHQNAVRFPGTVRDNFARFGLAFAGDLDPDSDALRLSGGEAQAMALERALACEPDVLLLDEATSSMDGELAGRWERRLESSGRAILWVTHDDTLAERIGARVERWS